VVRHAAAAQPLVKLVTAETEAVLIKADQFVMPRLLPDASVAAKLSY
jgi:hypothetical protein